MALVCEFLGIAPMGLSSVPATNAAKAQAGRRAGELVLDLLRRDVTPSKIITKVAIENAIVGVAATGGSTNAVLHLLAIANEANIPLSIDDFDRISSRVPILADLKPGGRFVATDLYAAGGTALVAKRLLEAGLLRGDCLTVTGRTLAEEAAAAKEAPAQQVVRKLDAHDLLRRRFLGCGCFFSESASGNGEAVPAKQSGFKEALCDQRSAARCVEIGCDKTSARLEISENGHAGT